MIQLKHIGKSAEDLRFFILKDGAHAGGITVHSVQETCFSYGVAVTETKRRQGVASSALLLLFDYMKRRGFTAVLVKVNTQIPLRTFPDIFHIPQFTAEAFHHRLGKQFYLFGDFHSIPFFLFGRL